MTIDPDVAKSPILYRLNAIHEIAVHIGQAHQRLTQLGLDQFLKEVHEGTIRKFTEISAAAAEKRIIDAIPFDVFVADIVNTYEDRNLGQMFVDNYYYRKITPFDKYVDMHHRPNRDGLTTDDIENFKRRYSEVEALKL